jgi:hypothetical protein
MIVADPPLQKKSTVHKWIDKMAVHLHNEDNKRLVQLYLIDPILNHIMDRVFPYLILTCALFSLLVILVGLTFVILLMKVQPLVPHSSVLVASTIPQIIP